MINNDDNADDAHPLDVSPEVTAPVKVKGKAVPPARPITRDICMQLAVLDVAQSTLDNMSKVTGWSLGYIRKVLASELYTDTLRDLEGESTAKSRSKIKVEVSKMADEIIKTLRLKIKDGSIDAVKVGLKILGFDDEVKQTDTSQNITVVMPGYKPENVIEIKQED